MSKMGEQPPVDEAAEEFRDLPKLRRTLTALHADFLNFKYTPAALAALIARSDTAFNEVGAVIVNHFKTHRTLPPASQSVYASWINLSGTLNRLRALTHSDVAALSVALDNTSTILENLKTAKRTVELGKYLTSEVLDTNDGGFCGSGGCESVLQRFTRQPLTTFDDIIGMEDAKAQIHSIATLTKFRLNSDSYNAMLLYGPPGTGKSSFVEAAAHHMGAQYVFITNADLFLPTFGAAEALLTSIFNAAATVVAASSGKIVVLFFDEIDTISGRDSTEVKASLTAIFLHNLDPKRMPQNVLIAGATNYIDRVDPAILRRLMPTVHVGLPTTRVIEMMAVSLCKFLPDTAARAEQMAQLNFSQANVKMVIESTLKRLKIWCVTPGHFMQVEAAGFELATLGRSNLRKSGYAPVYYRNEGDAAAATSAFAGAVWFDESDIAAHVGSIVYYPNDEQIHNILNYEIDAIVKAVTTAPSV